VQLVAQAEVQTPEGLEGLMALSVVVLLTVALAVVAAQAVTVLA
jgi:hypothetical protein